MGLATAFKLVPAVVAMHQFFAGRRRAGLAAFASFCAATLLGLLVLPKESWSYWTNLAGGDSGINGGMIFKTNQSVMGARARLTGSVSGGGLVLAGLVLVVGVAASVVVHRSGRERLGIALAGLLASPISWSHHFVWIIPRGWLVATERGLPHWRRALGLAHAA